MEAVPSPRDGHMGAGAQPSPSFCLTGQSAVGSGKVQVAGRAAPDPSPQPSDVAGSSAWTTIHGIAAYGITVTKSGQVESTVLAKPISPNPIRNKTIIAANRRRSVTRSS